MSTDQAQSPTSQRLFAGLHHLLRHERPSDAVVIRTLAAEYAGAEASSGASHEQTPGESLVLTTCGAQASITKASRRLRWRAWRLDHAHGRLHRAELDRSRLIQRPLLHPLGGLRPIAELQQETADLTRITVTDTEAGARHHERHSAVVRAAPLLITGFDLALLLYFLAGVMNVDPQHPLSLPGLAAVSFAALGSVVLLTWLTIVGRRLRSYRESTGEILWPLIGTGTRLLLLPAVAVIAALGTLMFLRVRQEVIEAYTASATSPAVLGIPLVNAAVPRSSGPHMATALGVIFALLSVAGNLAILLVHAFDGSTEGHHLRRLTRVLRRLERRLARAERRLHRCAERIRRQQRGAERARAMATGRSTGRLRFGTAQLNAGRALTRRPVLPAPRAEAQYVDLDALDVMSRHCSDRETRQHHEPGSG